ncbi:ATP-dependent endonuclease [Salmonella enterica]|uniref:ATP-dependent nuclease n=1 Tax=Salmonella enterica TaxID=28901 RepID=UPI0009AC927F|nr:ATP-dependent endonuclease [Salmonella enterica]EDT2775371.1 ATP-dependent endonuclease [Salmonella enterica subsp. enterica]EAO6613386.1 ATP-dependent endonuclease [Salmonella enterica]EAP9183709.1 ATP-dependent endonuclease [Salmonella enterica]EAY4064921.1 ATP-dependent endonuclease [Salmonella enterica]EBC2715395.1 ATP-dependent endonuclease [Salmonella enterica]
MYLAQLRISNFRKLNKAELTFQPGLNILVGPNNVGKTAVIDALRVLLAGHDEPYPRLDNEDIHRPKGGIPTGDIEFHYVFRDLDPDNEADFLAALKPDALGKLEAHITIRYSEADKTGRLRVKRWCGDHEDMGLTSDMMENLRGVYLPPMRDASQGLRPSRTSQLSRLLQLLADDAGKDGINDALKKLDEELKKHKPIVNTHTAIQNRHGTMLGPQLAQVLDLGLSGSDFQRLAARLSLIVDAFEIEQNGLGFNNLIFMAVVLSELAKNPEASYRSLIVEEPEAHLHPQLQAVLLDYLGTIKAIEGEKPVQLFVTSHSPNFASIADLDSITCLVDTGTSVETFFPRTISFDKGKREKLERYLDVTRAELFFARRAIFVEGAAELMLVNVLAEKCGYRLREHGVSLISVEGLNFDSFLPLFGEKALKIPVSIITDADPVDENDGIEEPQAAYPSLGDIVKISDNTAKMKKSEDAFVQVFHGVKTLEYDLALHAVNRSAMLSALKELHPQIGQAVSEAVDAAEDDTSKARALFSGMFERPQNNVQKGRFGQTLAQLISSGTDFNVPDYIKKAIAHACQIKEPEL